jgi:hypothetical protein
MALRRIGSVKWTTPPRARLAAAAGAFAVAFGLLSASPALALQAKLTAPDHSPHAEQPWPITVTAHKDNGERAHASAFYEFLFNGQVVATRYPDPKHPNGGHRTTPLNFYGKYKDIVKWPKDAIGYPLVFRVVVQARNGIIQNVDWPVKVQR